MWIVLSLPTLIGGYLFLIIWPVTRIAAGRSNGQKLYLQTLSAGGAIFALTFAGVELLRRFDHGGLWSVAAAAVGLLDAQIIALVPEEVTRTARSAIVSAVLTAGVGPALAALIGTVGYLLLAGRWGSWASARYHALFTRLDEMEKLVERASERNLPVAVTLEDRKVYVGYAIEVDRRGEPDRWLSLLPLASGYRKAETMEMEITTSYEPLYVSQAEGQGALGHLEPADFQVRLPVSALRSARLFDATAHAAFRKMKEGAPTPGANTGD